MTPNKIEYSLGTNIYGQPVRLIRYTDTAGVTTWMICRDEADQRDDRAEIGGLTPEQILKMAGAVQSASQL